jgi:hypothetical protein
MANLESLDRSGENAEENRKEIPLDNFDRGSEVEVSPENLSLIKFVRGMILEDAGKAKAAILDKFGSIDTEKAILAAQILVAGFSVSGLAGIAAGKIIMPKIKEYLPEEAQSLMGGAGIHEKVDSFAAEAKEAVVSVSDDINLFMSSLKNTLRVDELERSITVGADRFRGGAAA